MMRRRQGAAIVICLICLTAIPPCRAPVTVADIAGFSDLSPGRYGLEPEFGDTRLLGAQVAAFEVFMFEPSVAQ